MILGQRAYEANSRVIRGRRRDAAAGQQPGAVIAMIAALRPRRRSRRCRRGDAARALAARRSRGATCARPSCARSRSASAARAAVDVTVEDVRRPRRRRAAPALRRDAGCRRPRRRADALHRCTAAGERAARRGRLGDAVVGSRARYARATRAIGRGDAIARRRATSRRSTAMPARAAAAAAATPTTLVGARAAPRHRRRRRHRRATRSPPRRCVRSGDEVATLVARRARCEVSGAAPRARAAARSATIVRVVNRKRRSCAARVVGAGEVEVDAMNATCVRVSLASPASLRRRAGRWRRPRRPRRPSDRRRRRSQTPPPSDDYDELYARYLESARRTPPTPAAGRRCWMTGLDARSARPARQRPGHRPRRREHHGAGHRRLRARQEQQRRRRR